MKVFRKILFASVMLMIPICALPLTGFAPVPDHANEAVEAPADTESIDQGIAAIESNGLSKTQTSKAITVTKTCKPGSKKILPRMFRI